MALSRDPFLSLIGDAGTPESDKRYHAPQKYIDLAIFRKLVKHPF